MAVQGTDCFVDNDAYRAFDVAFFALVESNITFQLWPKPAAQQNDLDRTYATAFTFALGAAFTLSVVLAPAAPFVGLLVELVAQALALAGTKPDGAGLPIKRIDTAREGLRAFMGEMRRDQIVRLYGEQTGGKIPTDAILRKLCATRWQSDESLRLEIAELISAQPAATFTSGANRLADVFRAQGTRSQGLQQKLNNVDFIIEEASGKDTFVHKNKGGGWLLIGLAALALL